MNGCRPVVHASYSTDIFKNHEHTMHESPQAEVVANERLQRNGRYIVREKCKTFGTESVDSERNSSNIPSGYNTLLSCYIAHLLL